LANSLDDSRKTQFPIIEPELETTERMQFLWADQSPDSKGAKLGPPRGAYLASVAFRFRRILFQAKH